MLHFRLRCVGKCKAIAAMGSISSVGLMRQPQASTQGDGHASGGLGGKTGQETAEQRDAVPGMDAVRFGTMAAGIALAGSEPSGAEMESGEPACRTDHIRRRLFRKGLSH